MGDMDHHDFPDTPPIHMLPHDLMSQLCNILDANDAWEELVLQMPEISMLDVDGCRRYRLDGSPSWYLLRIWASKGFTIADLYVLFGMAKMLRCMKILRDQVPSKYHSIEDDLVNSGNLSNSQLKQTTLAKSLNTTSSMTATEYPSTDSEPLIATCSTPPVSTNEDLLTAALQNTLTVTYEELEIATNGFASDNILGKGGYGVVYKGNWKQMKVAVKRICSSIRQGSEQERLRQSLPELRTLAKYRHENILPLYAFCVEGAEPCLVYMFMANGSLEDRLQCRKGSGPLTWQQRYNIAEGTARGLLYLHTTDKKPIIHGDVKSANILLDKHFEPKLGDFGLSRVGQVEIASDEKSPLIASHIKGTLAYLPPEFITSKILSTKLDVYSYGIVLLELVTGQRAYSDTRNPHILLDYIFEIQAHILRGTGNVRDEMRLALMDRRQYSESKTSAVSSAFHELLKLGMLCSQKERMVRPNFEEITTLLNQAAPKMEDFNK